MLMYNSHTHTNHSLDCTVSAEEMCLSAIGAGLSGYSICDHCHIDGYISYSTYDTLKGSVADANMLKEKYGDKIQVFAGAEFDEILWHPEYAKRLVDSFKLDVVLASTHKVRNVPDTNFISRVNFCEYPKDVLHGFIMRYFEDVLETAEKCDFDILPHMTIIFRYVCGKYGLRVDFDAFSSVIDQILMALIKREKALEVNTSEVNGIGLMPNGEIIKRYHDLGGRLVTIGSDAHMQKNISLGFSNAVDTLKACGFKEYFYYKDRTPVSVLL